MKKHLLILWHGLRIIIPICIGICLFTYGAVTFPIFTAIIFVIVILCGFSYAIGAIIDDEKQRQDIRKQYTNPKPSLEDIIRRGQARAAARADEARKQGQAKIV